MLNDPKNNADTLPEELVILSRPEPMECGGTTASQLKNAPTEIQSTEMLLFSVRCSFYTVCRNEPMPDAPDHLYAYAAKCAKGTLVYFDARTRYALKPEEMPQKALLKEDLMPALAELTKELNLASRNGFHSFTHGLPQDFGGAIDIVYASGETIRTSDNQSPIISLQADAAIANFFRKALKGETIPGPKSADLQAVSYFDDHGDGGFNRATLTIQSDGTGALKKSSCYSFDQDPGKIYHSEKNFEKESVDEVLRIFDQCLFHAWEGLPEKSYKSHYKTLHFTMKDGSEFTVDDDRELPGALGGGLFKISLEINTKH